MSDLITDDGRTHIDSPLMRQSLVDRRVTSKTDSTREFEILPDVTLIGIGGRSIFDRGRDAILPLAEEIAEIRQRNEYKMFLGVGGGTRVRHTVSVAVDLGLPTGGIAQLVGAMEECNAVLLNALLAKNGSIPIQRDHFWDLPLYLASNLLPIAISIPPYHFWEPPPEKGPLPAHGSDFGLFMHAEVLGIQRIVYVKDEDGLYTKDPKKHDDAEFIPRITLDELERRKLDELILDPMLFEAWRHARHIQRVQIVNGLKREQLSRALDGEDVGTVIVKEDGHGG